MATALSCGTDGLGKTYTPDELEDLIRAYIKGLEEK